MKNILIRCDSSSTLGLGHVKRCLLLAKRLKEHDEYLCISFATQNLQGNINLEILTAGFNIYTLKTNDVEELSSLIAVLHLKLLIIDSYDIDAAFENELKIKNQELKILSFDDTLQPHHADMVLNHGIHAKKKAYKTLVPNSTQLFCGSKYTLLRDEFFEHPTHKKLKNSIAIILGGNDVLNISSAVADLLLDINPSYKITIITSSVNPHLQKLQSNPKTEVLVDIANIAQILSSKELVICASGGTLFEVLALKKKFINLQVSTNQQHIVDFLNAKKIFTTISALELNQTILEEKLQYVTNNNIYKNVSLDFSKTKLVKKILKALA
ncbi:MAG: UDP-2,4-diacetamido-2,4,6-trideoxy-beta-L-altropyranose hydrolase [Arcobacteraceae bacterium]